MRGFSTLGVTLLPYCFTLATSLYLSHVAFGIAVTILAVGTAIQTWVSYDQLYKPLIAKRNHLHAILVGQLLDTLLQEYRSLVTTRGMVRANVMLVRRKYRLIGTRYLQIDYSCGVYDETEREIRYDDGVGCCGSALMRRDQYWYDEEGADYAAKDMSALQRMATKETKSALSTPIYAPDSRTGRFEDGTLLDILNLDSDCAVDETRFNDQSVKMIAAAKATLIGIVLCTEVKI